MCKLQLPRSSWQKIEKIEVKILTSLPNYLPERLNRFDIPKKQSARSFESDLADSAQTLSLCGFNGSQVKEGVPKHHSPSFPYKKDVTGSTYLLSP